MCLLSIHVHVVLCLVVFSLELPQGSGVVCNVSFNSEYGTFHVYTGLHIHVHNVYIHCTLKVCMYVHVHVYRNMYIYNHVYVYNIVHVHAVA